ncbi:MAG: ABC transporter ATP-binding protein [Oscillospiraceae bacterium]|jgi:iron(III) transport system ATP-binding protein|nr:ABC transporter ATP-binding protein [Oscillospiraceae bacterium]
MADVFLRHLRKSYNGVNAVEDADFHIRSGEFFTLLGPSGCGKTTTLRMIAGFAYPTSGAILFGDRDVTALAPNKRDIGMVFQNYALFPHLTIGENVAFGLRIRKVSRADQAKRVARALDMVNLSGYEKRRVHEISGGQQQRVALARALVIEPTILLLDEPLSNLDAKLRDDTRSEIKRLQREMSITTIYVTHDQAEAMAVSDRILVMRSGVTQQLDTPQGVYMRPRNRFVAEFIGKHTLFDSKVLSVHGDMVTVALKDGTKLTGYNRNAAEGVSFTLGASVLAAIRPECFEPAGDREENILVGNVLHCEYTGMSAQYLVFTQGKELRATLVGYLPDASDIGRPMRFCVDTQKLYFLPAEDAQ